jgi:hypothetical protein
MFTRQTAESMIVSLVIFSSQDEFTAVSFAPNVARTLRMHGAN